MFKTNIKNIKNLLISTIFPVELYVDIRIFLLIGVVIATIITYFLFPAYMGFILKVIS